MPSSPGATGAHARPLWIIAWLAIASVASSGSEARADEGERIFSVYGGFASFAAGVGDNDDDTTSGLGAQVGVDYERGLTRSVWFRISGGGALYSGRPVAGSAQGSLGLTYVFDVLKYVPYAHVGLGGVALYLDRDPEGDDADNGTEFHPLVELGLGFDILGDDDSSFGFLLRFESFLDRTALFVGGVRYSWRWGFF